MNLSLAMPIRILILFVILSALKWAKASDSNQMRFGKTIGNCSCENDYVGDKTPVEKKKDEFLGINCQQNENNISCEPSAGLDRLICPSKCAKVYVPTKLTKTDYLKNLKTVEKDGREYYAKIIPKNVFKEFKRQFPNWWPTFTNNALAPDFQSDYKLKTHVILQAPPVTLIYFYKNVDDLLSDAWTWSFWNTETGELIYEGDVPYSSLESRPCLAPQGNSKIELVLFGISMGATDAGPCCGPYSLNQLKTKGPVKESDDSHNKLYDLCISQRSSELVSVPIKSIDGPANIRTEPNAQAKVVTSCADKSEVAILGSPEQDWYRVYCQGHSGWTHKKNIRP